MTAINAIRAELNGKASHIDGNESVVILTNFDEIKKRIASINVDELIEFCGGDTCENILCSFVIDGDCCGGGYKVSYDCGSCIKKFLQKETRG